MVLEMLLQYVLSIIMIKWEKNNMYFLKKVLVQKIRDSRYVHYCACYVYLLGIAHNNHHR